MDYNDFETSTIYCQFSFVATISSHKCTYTVVESLMKVYWTSQIVSSNLAVRKSAIYFYFIEFVWKNGLNLAIFWRLKGTEIVQNTLFMI